LDTIFGGAVTFSEAVTAMTGGKFTITARAAGELVPGLEILQSVQAGSVDGGHTASYYYRGLAEVVAFGTALPFGLTDQPGSRQGRHASTRLGPLAIRSPVLRSGP
jgi:TRAP-type mannitol/chloroaromatic compound transport system substrate-binding protein